MAFCGLSCFHEQESVADVTSPKFNLVTLVAWLRHMLGVWHMARVWEDDSGAWVWKLVICVHLEKEKDG
jgi:hypothetical protein